MTRIIFTFIFLITTSLSLYPNDLFVGFKQNAKGEYELSEVVTNNISGEMQYSNAQEWIAKSFGDYKKVIQFENKETLKLIMKGSTDLGVFQKGYLLGIDLTKWYKLHFIITIECKDSKFRYSITDIETASCDNDGAYISGGLGYRLEEISRQEKYLKDAEEQLAELNDLDIESMKKKARKELEKKKKSLTQHIDLHKRNIKEENKWLVKEVGVIRMLGKSLKDAISTDNDF